MCICSGLQTGCWGKIKNPFTLIKFPVLGPSLQSTTSMRQSESQFKPFSSLNGALVATTHKKVFVSASFTFMWTTNLKISLLNTPIICRKRYLVLKLVFNSLFFQTENDNDGGDNKACSSYTGYNNSHHMISCEKKVCINVMVPYNRRLVRIVNVSSSKQFLDYCINPYKSA